MIMAESPAVYDDISVYRRATVLTNDYLLDVFDVASGDNFAKKWDWVYHDRSSAERPVRVLPQLQSDHTFGNGQEWQVDEDRADSLQDNITSSEFMHIFSGATSVSGYQHITKHDGFVGDEEGWEIVFNTPQEYEDFVSKAAGILGYVAGEGMDGSAQSA